MLFWENICSFLFFSYYLRFFLIFLNWWCCSEKRSLGEENISYFLFSFFCDFFIFSKTGHVVLKKVYRRRKYFIFLLKLAMLFLGKGVFILFVIFSLFLKLVMLFWGKKFIFIFSVIYFDFFIFFMIYETNQNLVKVKLPQWLQCFEGLPWGLCYTVATHWQRLQVTEVNQVNKFKQV